MRVLLLILKIKAANLKTLSIDQFIELSWRGSLDCVLGNYEVPPSVGILGKRTIERLEKEHSDRYTLI